MVETDRALVANYTYSEPKQTIQFVLHSRASATDTLYAAVTMQTAGHMQWKMIRDKDTVSLMLSKVPENLRC